MKKNIIYIVGLLLIIIIISGSTYAYFSATIGKNNAITSTGDILEIIYDGDIAINGNIELSRSKEGGHRRVTKIGLSERSVGIAAHLYIQIQNISPELAVSGLKWEVYTLKNGVETFYNSGTFMQCGGIDETKSKCTSGDKLYMVTNYELSTTQSEFVVYLWLNGDEVGNEVINRKLVGTISAETIFLTGEIS